MHLLFFEDQKVVRFYPNALTRPLDEMRMGILTLGEKWSRLLMASSTTRLIRPWLQGVFGAPVPSAEVPWLWVNSRFVPDAALATDIRKLKPGEGLSCCEVPVAVLLPGNATQRLFKQQAALNDQFWSGFEVKKTPADPLRYQHLSLNFKSVRFSETSAGLLLDHSWDLFHHNAEQIAADIRLMKLKKTLKKVSNGYYFVKNPENVFLNGDVSIDPGAVLDASRGPIYLGNGSHIMSGALLHGPIAVCDNGLIRMGAKIYEGTTCGPYCKLGGEVSTAIFQAYSNKAHDGYIGNSVIGEWVNIGADTNNSNLKNNYTTIKVYDWESGALHDSGLQFCGLFLADHCKTAINSMLNSGTVCGVSSSILTNNFPPKFIPSFGWVTDKEIDVFELEKALDTARIMMMRRNSKMSKPYERMLRYLYTVRDLRPVVL